MAIKDENKQFYSYLLISKAKRAAFTTVFLTSFVLVTLAISANVIRGGAWTTVAIPVLLFSIPVLLFPPIEIWVYQPWQAKARKYERHYLS